MTKKITQNATLLLAIITFFIIAKSSAQTTLTGNEADRKIAGAELVRITKSSEVPNYVQFREGREIAFSDFENWFHSALHIESSIGLKLLSTEKDKLGMIHYRYQETNNGFPVEGTMYIVHTKNNKVVSVNGFVFNQLPGVASSAGLTKETALQDALTFTNAELYKWQNPTSEAQLKEQLDNIDATWFPKGELVYAPVKGNYTATNYRLCYKFDIYADKPLKRNFVYVDAQTGEIIFEQNRIKDINVPATAVTAYSGNRPIITDSNAGSYRLQETGRGLGIKTYNNQTNANPGGTVAFTNATTTWNNVNANLDQYATDAHWGAEKTYDFYDSLFGRNSIDAAGYALISYVHVDVNLVNAFWDGSVMSYGDGDGTTYTPLTAIDVTGHEITHGFTQFTSNLGNVPEGGALNEGYSDCMGISIRQHAYNSAVVDFLIGDQIGGAIFRDDQNPHNTQNPDTYLGQYWDAVNQEVHQNSTVFSHCYYIVAMGESGTNDNSDVYNVTGIGMAEAQQIWYRLGAVYMNPNTDYAEARIDAIQAATDLYGGCSPEVIAVTNAWFAVGVGAAYAPAVPVAAFSAAHTSYCYLPAAVSFSNNTTNGGNYTWYFGDGTTSNVMNPTHTYLTPGNFSVKLVTNGLCGADSVTQTNFISIVPLASPTANSPVNINCGSTATLNATGTSLSWYSTPMGGAALTTGATYTTPALNTSATYYVQTSVPSPNVYSTPFDNTMGAGGNNTFDHYLVFNVNQPCTLVSVLVYTTTSGNRTINLEDATGAVLQSAIINIPTGTNRITLNFNLTVGNNFRLECGAAASPNLYRNSAGANYPYTDPAGMVTITGNDVQDPARYYFFYDWELTTIPCTSAMVPVVVNVSGGMNPTFTDTQLGNTVTFTNTTVGGTSWLWDFGDGTTDTAQSPVHTYNTNGIFNVALYVYNGPCADSVVHQVAVITTGVNQLTMDNGELTIYPNPTSGVFTVSSSKFQVSSLRVVNVLGECVYQSEIHASTGSASAKSEIDLSAEGKGIYFVEVKTNDGVMMRKVVVQ